MDVLTPIVTGAMLTIFTVILAWLVKGGFDAMEKRFEAVDRRFDAVDRRFDAVDRRFEHVEAEIAGLRSDLTHVALAVGARARPQTG